jgi:hypothetical protein
MIYVHSDFLMTHEMPYHKNYYGYNLATLTTADESQPQEHKAPVVTVRLKAHGNG